MSVIGIHSLAITPLWNPAEADRILAPARANGAGLVEVPLLDPRTFDSEGTRRAAERNRMRVTCSLGLPWEFDLVKDPRMVADFLFAVLKAAKEAGSNEVSGVTYGTIGKKSGKPRTQGETDAMVRLIETVAKEAKRLGMRFGIEPCNRYETHLMNTGQDGAWFVEQAGAENVFIHLDTYHMNIEEVSMAEGFADAGDHLGYVHLSESNRGVPGKGTVDWEGTFKGLKDIGFEGPLTVESFVFVAPELAGGLAVWRPVAKRAADVIEVGLPFLIGKAKAAGIAVESP
ncbi:MAG: sugar phosphate isomerase/epimerase family protein [Paracoccaceae bacterium]